MTRQEFVKQYPQPDYLTQALEMTLDNPSDLTRLLLEMSRGMARREADAAFEKYLVGEEGA